MVDVIARAPIQRVMSRMGAQLVIAVAAQRKIVAAAFQIICPGSTRNVVVGRSAHPHMRRAARPDTLDIRADGQTIDHQNGCVSAATDVVHRRVTGRIQEVGVRPRPAIQPVMVSAAVDGVIAPKAKHRVIVRPDLVQSAAIARRHQISARGAVNVVSRLPKRRGEQHVHSLAHTRTR